MITRYPTVHLTSLLFQVASTASFAQSAQPGADDTALVEQQISQNQGLAHKMVGHINLAKLDSSFKYGKVTHEDESVITEHSIPIVDDVFLVSEYEEIFNQGKESVVEETAASIVHVGISVDLQEVDIALAEATAAIGEEDYTKTQPTLTR